MTQEYLHEIINKERLPTEFIEIVGRCYSPIAQDVAEIADMSGCLVLGVQGCQGSGKSTLSLFLKAILENEFQLPTAVLSIDDFYLTKAEREDLSKSVHPLLLTRGVPGTHDVKLATGTIDSLQKLKEGQEFAIPRFDKAADDRADKSTWDTISGPINIIILEGWCVGLGPQTESELVDPINDLEINEDPEGTWRRYVNDHLQNDYQDLFNKIEKLVVLKAPSFACVHEWRLLQEQKLAITLSKLSEAEREGRSIMSEAQVKRFVSHYQRLTEHAIAKLPFKAHWLLHLKEDHSLELVQRIHSEKEGSVS